MSQVQAPEPQTYRVFLSVTSDQGGRAIEIGGKMFVIAQGLALMNYALSQELEARGHRVNGVFVSAS
jgi:hypothetical protein